MGINYKFKQSKSFNIKYSNQKIKNEFYNSLIFFGVKTENLSLTNSQYLIGSKNDFAIINSGDYLQMLKQIKKLSYAISQKKGKILYINNLPNDNLEGIIKFFFSKSNQKNISLTKWFFGLLTKILDLNIGAVFLLNSSKNFFYIKEANRLGIPIINLNSSNSNIAATNYKIIHNNLDANAIFFNLFIITNSILEGLLFNYIKHNKKQTI